MNLRCLSAVSACCLLLATTSHGQKTWVGPSTGGNWSDDASWSGGAAPAAGDSVFLAGVTVKLSSATAPLADFTLTNALLVVSNWNSHLQAVNVSILDNGRITLTGPFGLTDTSRVSIVCTNFTLEAGGAIAVDGQGYRAAVGPGAGPNVTRTAGASHGGFGGFGQTASIRPAPYGSPSEPTDPGSGGGHAASGGAGGGAVAITASGTATVNGIISANGAAGLYLSGNYGGGGSGGSVLITCGTFAGTGLVRVQGGNGNNVAGRGAGGRIAVRYAQAPDPWPAVQFRATPGTAGQIIAYPLGAQPGTLYLADDTVLSGSLVDPVFADVTLIPGSSTAKALASWEVQSNVFTLATTNFQLTVAGDVVIGSGANAGLWNLDVGGTLTLTNGGVLKIASGATNGVGADYGALFAVTNDLIIGPSSWLHLACDDLTGGGPLVRAANVRIAAGGGINADGNGFRYAAGPGAGEGGERKDGGGYGGLGGKGAYGGYKGLMYGSPSGPALAGSGGGGNGTPSTAPHMGGYGGGLVRIQTPGTLDLNGAISANGGSYVISYAGGGSGGGVFIDCGLFTGSPSGVIRVNGGSGASSTGGGGGGGRICLNYAAAGSPFPRVQMQALGGTGYGNNFPYLSTPGSIYLSDASALDVVFDGNRFGGGYLFLTNLAEWATDSLAVSNCILHFGPTNFVLIVSNALAVATNGSLGAWQVRCDNLTLTNNGSLVLTAQPTNGAANDEWSGLLAVTQDLVIGRSSWIYPASDPASGGSVRLTARTASIGAGGGINAFARGFGGSRGPGYGINAIRRAGGGYGGRGGFGDQSPANESTGATNGSLIAPLYPGSGGCRLDYGGYGGGLIRLEIEDALTLDGTLHAGGGSLGMSQGTYPGGGSGGGILVLCGSLSGGPSGLLTAPGGTGSTSSGGGGGGRIAVGVGLSPENRATLLSGMAPAGLTLYDVHAGFEGALSVAPGTGWVTSNTNAPAKPGTATFLSAGSFVLTIQGDPAPFGSPAPDPYGTLLAIPPNAWVTNAVATPAEEANGLRRACIGWTLALTNGMLLEGGPGSEAVFHFTNDMVLTWRWTNEWNLVLTNGPNGSVNSGDFVSWYTNATVVSAITATPDAGHGFERWIGDVPAGLEQVNPLALTMDRPRHVEAVFTLSGGQAKTWSGTGAWSDHGNWSPAGMPGAQDAVSVASGTVVVSYPVACASLGMNSGAVMVFSNWNNRVDVGGDTFVASGAVMRVSGPYEDAGPSNRLWLASQNLVIEDRGVISADAAGFVTANGVTHAGVQSGRGGGGGHGGRGGYGSAVASTPGGAYDSLESPELAGGGGGNLPGGTGGGAIRLDVAGRLTVDGTISANGIGGEVSGGGAGGAIWITAGEVAGATSGLVRANGGSTTLTHGGGAGGRIAVHAAVVEPACIRFQAGTGYGFTSQHPDGVLEAMAPQNGTVYLVDPRWLTPVLDNGRFMNLSLTVSNMTGWAVDRLAVTNCSLAFATPGFAVMATNGVSVDGASADFGAWGLATDGDVLVTNGASLRIFGNTTNGALPEAGTAVSIGGALVVGPGSWIRPVAHPVNGGGVRFLADRLEVAAGGGFDAVGKGYAGTYGPGRGGTGASGRGGGGGYGGMGGVGDGIGAYAGAVYGWAAVPELAGSGGGNHLAGGGGGLVWIETGKAVVDGTLNADGSRSWELAGGGSGGGILLACDSLDLGPAAALTARGGNAGNTSAGGGGGGGRVAVWLKLHPALREAALAAPESAESLRALAATNAYNGIEAHITVTNGVGYLSGAMPGTIRFLVAKPAYGSMIMIK